MKLLSRLAILAAVCPIATVVLATPAQAATVFVAPGHSIQAAVNNAHSGDIIQLLNGNYAGGVVVARSGITIRGAGPGTVIQPMGPNACAAQTGGSDSGFCVVGANNVTIKGLTVRGFDGFGVFGFATDKLRVEGVWAQDNLEYGITEFNSTRGMFLSNHVTGTTEEAALYVGDIGDAQGTVVHGNYASGNALGLLVRHAHHVVVTANTFTGNCTAIALVDDGQPGGQGHTLVDRNQMSNNNVNCPPHEEVPPLQGTGVGVIGGVENQITRNLIQGNMGNAPFSGGVVLVPGVPSTEFPTGRPAAHNVISQNIVRGNAPADLIDHSGSNSNTWSGNICGTSIPGGLCQP
jgi:hypothetical protein